MLGIIRGILEYEPGKRLDAEGIKVIKTNGPMANMAGDADLSADMDIDVQ